MKIKFYNRVSGQIENELIYGNKFIEWLYLTKTGDTFQDLICKAPISRLYGAVQDLTISHLKIAPFIEKFNIQIDDYLPEEGRDLKAPYSTFNQFFVRRFKDGKRPFVKTENEMAAFSEARYYGYEKVLSTETVPVKGHFLSSSALLGHAKWHMTFEEGPLLLARLCPVDYHRYHYPDDGVVLDNYRVPGVLHSVNPIALKAKNDILITNERHVTIVETKNFGKLAYIEVGATCVGKIVQTASLEAGTTFKKGEEKGLFLFGGSTVIVLGEKGKWKPSADILSHTKEGIETYLHLGTTVATKG